MQKETVEIIAGNGVRTRKKYAVKGNSVIIRERNKKTHSSRYAPTFDETCFVYFTKGIRPFKRLKRKLMLLDGKDECISFKDPVELGRYDVEEHFKYEVYNKASTLKTNIEVPFMLQIVLIVGIVLQIVTLLVLSGRLRL